MRNDNVKPNWYCVAIDETKFWNLDPEDVPFIKQIYGVYTYDASTYTYCCELTPSYWLNFIENSFVFNPDTPEEIRDCILEKYACAGGEGFYQHVSDVKAISLRHHYGESEDEGEDRGEAEVREYYQSNPVF